MAPDHSRVEVVQSDLMTTRAVFPGSFDPFTVAHLAIAEAAHDQLGVDQVVCSISEVPLAKDPTQQTPVPERVSAIDTVAADRPWLRVQTTPAKLLADVAQGFDWLIVGADKWEQLHDVAFYGDDPAARDAALSRLPSVAYVPRAGIRAASPPGVTVLDVDSEFRPVSATAVRNGRHDWRA